MVVESPSFCSAGSPTTEFGAIRMVSSPRVSSTRPLRPVRMVSPGFKTSSGFSEACRTPEPVIQTSPEDLLTDQLPLSAAIALEAANANVVARTHANSRTVRMFLFLSVFDPQT